MTSNRSGQGRAVRYYVTMRYGDRDRRIACDEKAGGEKKRTVSVQT